MLNHHKSKTYDHMTLIFTSIYSIITLQRDIFDLIWFDWLLIIKYNLNGQATEIIIPKQDRSLSHQRTCLWLLLGSIKKYHSQAARRSHLLSHRTPILPIQYVVINPAKKVFIIGPPGFKVREFALQVADHYKFTTISVGDLLKKEVSKKQQLG